MNPTEQNPTPILSLTALWALVESGLGGIMHALHLPFTGVFIGGFAVLIIGLIAQFSQNPFQEILKATLIVVLIKAAVSPYTSPTAYVAVGFQGLLGAIMLQRKSLVKWAIIPFALLCMIESGAQKLLMVWLVFGNSFFEAIDVFFNGALKSFGVEQAHPFSFLIVALYCAIYLFWGLALGIWGLKIPKQINERKEWYTHLKASKNAAKSTKLNNRKWPYIIVIIALITLIFSYFYNPAKGMQKGVQLFLRASFILILWFGLIIPIGQHWIKKWRLKQTNKNENQLLKVNNELDLIKTYTKPLYQLLKTKYKGFKLIKELVLGLLTISLYKPHE